MKKVKTIPPFEYENQRDPWLDELLDGELRELSAADWQGRYKSTRSAASAIHQAARKRGFPTKVAIRGDVLYVQADPASTNGQAAAKVTAKRATAKRVTARKKAAAA